MAILLHTMIDFYQIDMIRRWEVKKVGQTNKNSRMECYCAHSAVQVHFYVARRNHILDSNDEPRIRHPAQKTVRTAFASLVCGPSQSAQKTVRTAFASLVCGPSQRRRLIATNTGGTMYLIVLPKTQGRRESSARMSLP